MIHKSIILALFSTFALVAHAQEEDDTWWKRMFSKETVEEMESTPEKEDAPVLESAPDSIAVVNVPVDSIQSFIPERKSGEVWFTSNSSLDSLDRAAKNDPIPMKGYRIQVYFGNLKEAKQLRGNLIMEKSALPCYLVSNAPNFAVRLGNYRNEYEAHKDLNELKARFPQAHIVSSEIELPELDH